MGFFSLVFFTANNNAISAKSHSKDRKRSSGPRRDSATSRWLAAWVVPVLDALVTGSERLRSNVSIHVLPCILQLDSTSLSPLLKAAVAPIQGVQLTTAHDGNVRASPKLLHARPCFSWRAWTVERTVPECLD